MSRTVNHTYRTVTVALNGLLGQGADGSARGHIVRLYVGSRVHLTQF